MTKQEAIKQIQGWKYIFRNCAPEEKMEALDMAIEALNNAIFTGNDEDKPINEQVAGKLDLISRQDAIEAYSDLYWMDERLLRFREELDKVFDKIRNLPSAQSEQPEIIVCGDCKHWICHDKRCGYWNHGVKPLEWCSHAERRTDERFNQQTGCD